MGTGRRLSERTPHTDKMNSILGEVEKGTNLKHVEVNDKAAPVIEADVKIKPNPFKQVEAELNQPHELKHVDEVKDKSAPLIEPDVQIKANGHNDLMSEIRRASQENVKVN